MTPFSFLDRMRRGSSGTSDLEGLLSRWSKEGVWVPPRQDQAFNQGGIFVLRGRKTLFAHYDPSAGAHADLEVVKRIALESLGKWEAPRA